MAELKTKPTGDTVRTFLDGIEDEERRRDCRELAKLMTRTTGSPPKMWGTGIVGFGTYHYTYDSGREGDWFLAGFSPRKQDLTLYVMAGFQEFPALMKRLGKYKTGKSCLYVKRLSDIDAGVLDALVRGSVESIRERVAREKAKRARG
jgi:hypothetical protein